MPPSPTRNECTLASGEPESPSHEQLQLCATSQASPLASREKNHHAIYRNGYALKEKPPSYKPYNLYTPGRRRRQAFAFKRNLPPDIAPAGPLSTRQWSMLARGAKAIPLAGDVKELQATFASDLAPRHVCVIAPTGFGKSLLWTLPLLALDHGVVLVITPFTSLGEEGEHQTNTLGIVSAFVHAGRKDTKTLERVASGFYHVTYVCVEMLESPVFAQILYSEWYKCQLVVIFIDQAHCMHESDTWRSSYSRLHQLRMVVGSTIPLLAMSATLPSLYQTSLITHAGLKENYTLFNAGNFRPELSTVIIHMEHDAKSFKDLRFMLPRAGQMLADIDKSLVYCDDTMLLMEMLYWFRQKLDEISIPGRAVDILHAGLSPNHQGRALDDFQTGCTRILLSMEKLSAGMNFPAVKHVTQYLCSGRTMAKADQRCGCGARSPGMIAIGYCIAEKKFKRGGKLSPQKPGREDPGIIELVQTELCCNAVFDQYLENPPRSSDTISLPRRLCCSNCFPQLIPPCEFKFIMVNPTEDESQRNEHRITGIARQTVLACLQDWQESEWRERWRVRWPLYGPKSLVSDKDLETVADHAGAITQVGDLYPLSHIVHWDELAKSLFRAVQSALHSTSMDVPAIPSVTATAN
ncbi:ATP-dependent DNA helicase [Rhodofomes roseus]|uniref:DNA 3'-5' helicase n=1 Tax=Rhodofomes roseus TaxID=34475 RepID=A0ABQ8KPZ7_9APHY|nr:ATP-dependent DNA helicase [Rhodofomes roseus]KAH9840238.1 ATP-dependent DNA helicase [Rhodofomes roseus]